MNKYVGVVRALKPVIAQKSVRRHGGSESRREGRSQRNVPAALQRRRSPRPHHCLYSCDS
ncbi:hypothetical protein [Kamptonema formosum]|uniref:hypothetical protein n=1 Tax=Kamptonema formosum TaxID=331992 RepID=UPI0012DEF9A1|nr:hypothetical protein [Oscillatoria sp. PCC 10802]